MKGTSLSIKQFAANHRLRTRKDEDETTIIPGKSGQIYDHEDGKHFGVLFQSEKHQTAHTWNKRRRECIATGMELHQDGHAEGSLLFDPSNPEQVRAAVKVAGIRPKRIPSPAQLSVLERMNEVCDKRRQATRRGQVKDAKRARNRKVVG